MLTALFYYYCYFLSVAYLKIYLMETFNYWRIIQGVKAQLKRGILLI